MCVCVCDVLCTVGCEWGDRADWCVDMQSYQCYQDSRTCCQSCRRHYTAAPGTPNLHTHTHTHTHPFNGRLSGSTRVSQYQKGKTDLEFTGARDSEWQWHQLGDMQVCISLQTDNHASTSLLKFFTGRMPFLPPNQQRQSTEGTIRLTYLYIINTCRCFCHVVNVKDCSLSNSVNCDGSKTTRR